MTDRRQSGIALLSRPETMCVVRESELDRVVRLAGTADHGPGTLRRHEVAPIAGLCLELVVALRTEETADGAIGQLEHRAVEWARDGISVDTVLDTVHRCVRVILEPIGDIRPAQIVDLLGRVSTAIAGAYLRYALELSGHGGHARDNLAEQLIVGSRSRIVARDCGVVLAAEYWVLAVDIGAEPIDDGLDERVRSRRAVTRLRLELDRACDGDALAALSAQGGTVLIPTDDRPEAHIDTVAAALSRASGRQLTVTVVRAALDDIPGAAECAHELLEIVRRLGRVGGVHRFSDFALEYQLSRPGPAREYLRTLLEPLSVHPELLDTLRCHVANDLNRRKTARMLHLHTNTVDYRIRRIAALTGLDAKRCPDLWYLRSALVVAGMSIEGQPK
ncbi:PucR family transcriptional regulator [Nocardia sp. NPDC058705]|uniref:PucR family transcriptional regulator n=1 Tax=Nocardia sp. NPDC058705 TaxID=3346609 RepID=UPI0036B413A8